MFDSDTSNNSKRGARGHWGIIMDQPEPPCIECALAAHCAEKRVACEQFGRYVSTGSQQPRQTDDHPTRKTYNRIYPTEGLEAEQQEIDYA